MEFSLDDVADVVEGADQFGYIPAASIDQSSWESNMKHQTKLPICNVICFLFLLVLSISYSTPLVAGQEVEDEREFDYVDGSQKGPNHWGQMKKEWATCNNGGMQSPIDLLNQRVKIIPNLGKLKRSYKPCNATIKNRGHDITIQWEGDAGSFQINGTDYLLKQCHWHSPSEHSINGRRYDMELHMVHLTVDPNVTNKIAVVGVLYKIGRRHDSFLCKLRRDVRSMTDRKEERSIGKIDPRQIKMGGNNYYRYMGSLTVPPCTEGVIWTIHKQIRSVSREQVKLFRLAVHDYAERNARPIQPLNLRDIEVYEQTAIQEQHQ